MNDPIHIPETKDEIRKASRAELVAYLEAWGFACYHIEKTSTLRTAALQNSRTEADKALRAEEES